MTAGSGQIITFYSYKGGTGRSMHLANVGWILASNGKRVLMVDWDLEAPGLHRYFQPFLIDKELTATDGLIDLLWDFSDAAMTPVAEAERAPGWHEAFTDLTRCTAAVRWTFTEPGHLDLLSAGRQGASYSRRVTSFNWQNFYDRLGGGVFLESLKARMRKAYDYVLIDSRTGVTDTAGICTVQLPDTLVVCFTPNNQSIEGCAAIAQSVHAQWTQDGQRADHRRILPLLTRIDGSEKDKLNARRDLVHAKFDGYLPDAAAETPDVYWRDTEVPYVPWYSYEEVLAVFADRHREKISVLDSAEALTRLLTHGEIAAGVRPSDEERAAVMAQIASASLEVAVTRPMRPVTASPYPGLRPFSRDNADVFFGRKAEIETLAARLRAGERELYVVGPSGSGKSSIVQAGLVALLKRSSGRDLPRFLIRTVEPGAAPVARLADALEIGPEVDASGWSDAVEALLARHPECERLLVIIDQLEDLFMVAPDEQRTRMLGALGVLRRQPRVALLLVVRSDFYGRLLDSPLGIGRAPMALHVAPLRGDALRETIVGPAQAVGAHIEPALVERLLADAADEPGALPLLQDTLAHLWERSDGRVLTVARYTEIGGNAGGLAAALALRAEATYADLDQPGQDVARRIVLRLISFGEGRAITRRRQRRDQLAAGQDGPAFDPTLQALVAARLLTTDVHDGVVQVDLASERLILAWRRVLDWVSSSHDDEQRRRQLEAAATAWRSADRDRAYLLVPGRAREAARWLREDSAAEVGVSDEVRALVVASERAQRSRTIRSGIAIGALAVTLSSAVVWGAIARKQKDEVERALRERSSQVADVYLAQGRALLAADHGAQAAPYLLAARELGVEDVAARTSFRWAGWQIPELSLHHRDAVTAIAWSPDGERLATAAREGSVRVWSASTGQQIALAIRNSPGVLALAWSRDGKQLATASSDGDARIWAGTGKPVALLRHQGAVRAVAWSPDGTRLATASADGSARIWDATAFAPLVPPLAHGGAVVAAAWSPDGAQLATVSGSGARIWDAGTGKSLRPLGASSAMLDVGWNPDGVRLQGVADDGLYLWNARTGEALKGPAGGAEIRTAARSPDGSRLAFATSADRGVAIVQPGSVAYVRLQSPVAVDMIAWSGDGTRLATTGEDDVVRVWDAATGQEVSLGFALPTAVAALALSPDGQRVAATGRDGEVRLWRVQSRLAVPAPLAHRTAVQSIAWRADSRTLATVDALGVAYVWDATSGAEPKTSEPLTDPGTSAWSRDALRLATQFGIKTNRVRVLDALDGSRSCSVATPLRAVPFALSPDGARLATYSSSDRRLVIWDAQTCREVASGAPVAAEITVLVWDPAGARLASASTDNTVRVWGPDGRPVASIPDQVTVVALAWSPDGTRLATTGTDRVARIWDASSGTRVAATPAHQAPIAALAWSPDGGRLATASADRTARVWSAVDGSTLTPPLIHPGAVTAVAWSPDGTRLATAADDRGLRIWDAARGQPVCPPIFHAGGITALAWSPDGARVATATGDNLAMIWDLAGDPGALADWRHVVDAGPYALTSSGMLVPRDAPAPDEAR